MVPRQAQDMAMMRERKGRGSMLYRGRRKGEEIEMNVDVRGRMMCGPEVKKVAGTHTKRAGSPMNGHGRWKAETRLTLYDLGMRMSMTEKESL